MDSMTLIAIASIVTAGLTIALGSVGPALGEGRAVATALSSLAQQPDAAATITRTLFVGLAMIESVAIYCFVVSMILMFANPFWNHVIAQAASTSLSWCGCSGAFSTSPSSTPSMRVRN
jgi:F-type H+-transporting ATPase subunit c